MNSLTNDLSKETLQLKDRYEKVKKDFDQIQDVLIQVLDTEITPEMSTLSIIGERGYGKSTVVNLVKDYIQFLSKPQPFECVADLNGQKELINLLELNTAKLKYRTVVVDLTKMECLEDSDFIPWFLATLLKDIEQIEKKWMNISVCCKEELFKNYLSRFKKKLCKDKAFSQAFQNACNKFFLKESCEALIRTYLKTSKPYKAHILKKGLEDKFFVDDLKDISASKIDFLDVFNAFIEEYDFVIHELYGQSLRVTLFIDDLDIYHKVAMSCISDIEYLCTNDKILKIIAFQKEVLLQIFENNTKNFKGSFMTVGDLKKMAFDRYNKFAPLSMRYRLEGISDLKNFIPLKYTEEGVTFLTKLEEKCHHKSVSHFILCLLNNSPRILTNAYDAVSKEEVFDHTSFFSLFSYTYFATSPEFEKYNELLKRFLDAFENLDDLEYAKRFYYETKNRHSKYEDLCNLLVTLVYSLVYALDNMHSFKRRDDMYIKNRVINEVILISTTLVNELNTKKHLLPNQIKFEDLDGLKWYLEEMFNTISAMKIIEFKTEMIETLEKEKSESIDKAFNHTDDYLFLLQKAREINLHLESGK